MNCDRAMIITLAINIGIHQTINLANLKWRMKEIDIDETMNCDENWNSSSLTQIYNWDCLKMMRIVLIL